MDTSIGDDDLFDMAIAPAATSVNPVLSVPAVDISSKIVTGPPNQQSSESYSGRRFCCYISNLTWWTTDDDLSEFVTQQGCETPLDIKFHEYKNNGQSKGFALLVFKNENDVKTLSDKSLVVRLHDRIIQVWPYNKQSLAKLEDSTKKNNDLAKKKDGVENKLSAINHQNISHTSSNGISINSGNVPTSVMPKQVSCLPTVNLAKPIQQPLNPFGPPGINGPSTNIPKLMNCMPPGVNIMNPFGGSFIGNQGMFGGFNNSSNPMIKSIVGKEKEIESLKEIGLYAISKAKQKAQNKDYSEAYRILKKAYEQICDSKLCNHEQIQDMVNAIKEAMDKASESRDAYEKKRRSHYHSPTPDRDRKKRRRSRERSRDRDSGRDYRSGRR
uniref:RRM domain-containing protein n=1 Tax=Strongyloides venezuelensis TaxID=75913 RepID=A0A0K0FL73_STRVS